MAQMTVLFSTLNGAHTLPRMLGTLERLVAPAGGWKVVAVNNGSTDSSSTILEQSSSRLPMTIINEPRRGKNIALNIGLTHAEGDLVVFTDDDVLLAPDWLLAIQEIAAQRPNYDIFGGAIYPVWEAPPPAWVLRCAPTGIAFSWTDFEEGPVDPSSIWGPSMAVRAEVFRMHRFCENIGPNASKSYPMGSETEFVTRANKSGHHCWHFHSSPVGHIVRAHQLSREWLLRRAYNLGRGKCRQEGNSDVCVARLFGYPRYLVRQLVDASLDVAMSHLFSNFDARFRALWRFRELQGDFAERIAVNRAQRALADSRMVVGVE